MKVVLATPLYPPDIGGPATYAKLLADGLPAKGIEVTLVKFGDVRRLPKGIRHFAYVWRVYRALRDADLAFALDPVSTGLPTCLASWFARKPFVVKIVGDYAWEQGRQRANITATLDEFVQTKHVPLLVWLWRTVQTSVAHHARKVIVPSEYLKGIVMAWGIPSTKIEVIYNAVSVENKGTVPPAVVALSRPLIVTAGRLVPWKHIEGVIDAAARIPEASLTIIGDGPERATLARRAQEKLPGRCVFTGAISHADVLAIVAAADVFVLNSSYEGLSHHLIEALMLGTPVVATRVGGNPELVEEQQLVENGNTEELANRINFIIKHRAEIMSPAPKQTKETYTVNTMLTRTAELLASLS